MKIKKENIEALLFDYAEGNLSREEAKKLEAFLEKQPQYAALSEDYDKSERLEEPSDIVFKEKEALFCLATQRKRKSFVLNVPKFVWVSSAAAVLLLLIVLLPLSNDEQNMQESTNTAFVDNIPQKACIEKSVEREIVAKEKNKSAIKENETETYSKEKVIEKNDIPQEIETETEIKQEELEETMPEALLAMEETVPQVQEEEKTLIIETSHENYTYEERSLKSLIMDYIPVEEAIAKVTETAWQKGAEALVKITGFISKIKGKESYTTYTEVRRSVNVKS